MAIIINTAASSIQKQGAGHTRMANNRFGKIDIALIIKADLGAIKPQIPKE